MSEKKIRAALEERLAALGPALSTAYENQDFTPVPGTAYQRVNLLRADPEDPEFGPMKRHLGIFQVTLFYPQGDGPGTAEARADLLVAHFKRKTSLTKDGVVVTIDGTPRVLPGFNDGDRWVVPVRIPYFSHINA